MAFRRQCAAVLAYRGPLLRLKARERLPGRADSERQRVPEIVKARVVSLRVKRPAGDAGQAGALEPVGDIALPRPRRGAGGYYLLSFGPRATG